MAASLVVVAWLGAAEGGQYFSDIATIELAALLGRLGLPAHLARQARLALARVGPRRPKEGPPTYTYYAFPLAVLAACAIGYAATGIDPVVAGGAGSLAVLQSYAGWHRGSGRPVLSTFLHPAPALLGTMLTLALGLPPTSGFVTGVVFMCGVEIFRHLRTQHVTWLSLRAGRSEVLGLGLVEFSNQALVLAPPILLTAAGEPGLAAVFGLATRLTRPLGIARFSVNHAYGPLLAGRPGEYLTAPQRQLATRISLLLASLGILFIFIGTVPVGLLESRLASGERLDDLQVTWLVLTVVMVLNGASGPTGQILTMRGHSMPLLGASTAGVASALCAFVLVGGTELQRITFASAISGVTQTMIASVAVSRIYGWTPLSTISANRSGDCLRFR